MLREGVATSPTPTVLRRLPARPMRWHGTEGSKRHWSGALNPKPPHTSWSCGALEAPAPGDRLNGGPLALGSGPHRLLEGKEGLLWRSALGIWGLGSARDLGGDLGVFLAGFGGGSFQD